MPSNAGGRLRYFETVGRIFALAALFAAGWGQARRECPAWAESGGWIFGRVVRGPDDPGVDNAKLTLEGADRHLESVTRGDGRFAFPGLPGGDYRLKTERRGYVAMPEPIVAVHLGAGKCVEVVVQLRPDRRIRGHVYASDGTPARHVNPSLLPAEYLAIPQLATAAVSATLDRDGRYEFPHLAPGDYYLGVNLNRPPGPDAPYPRYFYPGTEDPQLADTIHIPEDGAVIDADLTLPPEQHDRVLSGIVTWPDGKPASEANLYLEDARFPMMVNAVQATTDDRGFFTLKCYDTTSYILHAVSACGQVSDCRSAEPQIIPPGVSPDLRMVLKRPGSSVVEAYGKALERHPPPAK